MAKHESKLCAADEILTMVLDELEEQGYDVKFVIPFTTHPVTGSPITYKIIYKERQ